MGRTARSSKENLNRGAWTTKEDRVLRDYVQIHGECGWNWVADKAGLNRSGKSCRLRWLNYLRPNIKRGNISSDENELIIRLHRLLGNRWSLIAGRLPGRTDNEIKNHWNSHLKKGIGTVFGRDRVESKIAMEDKQNFTLDLHLVPEKQISVKENNTSPATDSHQIVRPTALRCSRIVIDPDTNREKSNDVLPVDEKWMTLFDFDLVPEEQISVNENNASPATDGHQIVEPTAVQCSRIVIDSIGNCGSFKLPDVHGNMFSSAA